MLLNINAECARRGLKKQEVADMLGVSVQTLRNWVKYETIPASKLRILSDLLGKSADYLLGFQDSA